MSKTGSVRGLQLEMMNIRSIAMFVFGIPLSQHLVFAETFAPTAVPMSVNANLVLDAAGPEQRTSLSAIYLIACPGVGFGSGFYLSSGLTVTNAHVVATCTKETLIGVSTTNDRVTFSQIITDKVRDLAVLVPHEKLNNGFKLAPEDDPLPGTTVSTWGYPFGYKEHRRY